MAKAKRVPARDADAQAGATGKPLSDSAGRGAWHGQEARPGPGGSETPEAAAVRAEGNAPITVADAMRRSAADADGTPAASRRPEPQDAADSDENAEEKRIAAAEEHTAEEFRRPPHGKL